MSQFPHVKVAGDPSERGRAYGEQARDRIRLSIEAYRDVFFAIAGWDWNRVRREAARYQGPIEAFDERFFAEIRGIAEGAAVDVEDVLSINVRTEIMFAAKSRLAGSRENGRATGSRHGECSAFAVLPEASSGGHTLLGQNWDWLLHAHDTLIVLEAEQEEAPNFVSIVEAGLLAKTGLNSSGLGVATNALVTDDDRGEPGVPYHVLLRAFMDCENLSDAVAVAQRSVRSSSANYLVAHGDGVAVDIEAAPGDFAQLFIEGPEDGVMIHTNHFRSGSFRGRDVSSWVMPDSPIRLECLRIAIKRERPDGLTLEELREVLRDHANYPSSICSHTDSRMAVHDRSATVASVLMDLDDRRLWLAGGQPCDAPYRELHLTRLLGKRSPILDMA